MPSPGRYSAMGKMIEAGPLWSGNWGTLGKGLLPTFDSPQPVDLQA